MAAGADLGIATARAALREAADALREDIRAYPPPIAGCDAQFNHLLRQRDRVTAALAELEKEAET